MDALLQALAAIADWHLLAFLAAGVGLGLVFGALPGLTATMGIALLVPLTFWVSAEQGLAMLLGVYCGAIPAGGVPAVLLNVPGTPASIAATWDGYPLTRAGQAGVALKINAAASLLGQLASFAFLVLASFPLAQLGLRLGPAEYFGLALFGLSLMAGVSAGRVWEGMLSGMLGLALSTVGLDPMTAYPRYTFGQPELMDGIPFIPVMIGLFGLGEVLVHLAGTVESAARTSVPGDHSGLSRRQWLEVLRSGLLGSGVGTVVGAIPAAGGDIAAVIAWDQARRWSASEQARREFGRGSLRGLAASCAAANAAIGGAMTTMLTLGIPGDAPSAVLIGALLIHGVQPGPLLFRDHPSMVWTIVLLMSLAAGAACAVGWLGAGPLARLTRLPAPYLWAVVLVLSLVGSFALNNSLGDVWIMFGAGLLGFVFRRLEIPLGPLVLGLILGPIMESNLRRALILSRGDWTALVRRPIFLLFFCGSLAALAGPAIKAWRGKAKPAAH